MSEDNSVTPVPGIPASPAEAKPLPAAAEPKAISASSEAGAGAQKPSDTAEPTPARKPRRRVAKKADEPVPAQETGAPASESAEAPAPKKRTRKATAKKAPEVEDAATSEEAVAEKPKRRPGRPRKVKAAADGDAAASQGTMGSYADAAAAETQPAVVSGDAPVDAEKPKRRPGRPRKTKAEKNLEPVEASDADSSEQAEVEKPRRRRTSRQQKAEGGEGAAEASTTNEEQVAEHAPGTESAHHEAAQAASEQHDAVDAPRASEAVSHGEESKDSDNAKPAERADGEQPFEGEGPRRRGRNRRNKFDRERNGENGQGQQTDGSRSENGQGEGGRGRGRNDRYDRNDRRNNRDFKDRRNNRRGRDFVTEPSVHREDFEALKVSELRAKADELGIDHKGLLKTALIDKVYEAAVAAEGFRPVDGILEIGNEGYGWLRTGNYMEGDGDCFVHQQMIRSLGLRPGDRVAGTVGPGRSNSKYPPLVKVATVNGSAPENLKARPRFRDLTPVFPNERLVMEMGKDSITGRAIDLVSPIGKGQRGLIVSPPKAGKTTVLKKICQSIAHNNPEVHLFCLLVDERPEEVTDMQRSIKGEVVASTFDMPAENHTHVSELVIEHAKRLVEMGEDVVVVLDSITRLARAYNLAQPASGRILSGGVDSAALYPPKKFLGAARNIENGGSLTIIASALVDTGSKMDEVIFEEFKGTGNMELKLDRDLADRRIFPAIDPVSSGTRNENLLIPEDYAPFVWGIRRVLANMNNVERAANALVKGLKGTNDNREFLIKSAKKAQQSDYIA